MVSSLPRPPYPSPPRQTTEAGLFDSPTPEHYRDCVQWWDAATVAMWQLIDRGTHFDARAITDLVGREYPGDGRNIAAFLTKHAAEGNIRRVAYIPSRSSTSNAVVSLWQPTDRGRETAARVLPPEQRWTVVADASA